MPNASVCFSHETALRIARAAQAHGMEPSRVNDCRAERFSSSLVDVRAAYEKLCALFGDDAPSLPASFLTATARHSRRMNQFQPRRISAELPHKSIMHLGNGIYFASPELAFTQACAEPYNFPFFLQLAAELCGTYQTKLTAACHAYQIPELMTKHSLETLISRCYSLKGASRAASLLPYVVSNSASPRETQLALLLGLPMKYGGYGLGMPEMNYEVEASDTAHGLTGKYSFRCDLCWSDARLDVEYQSTEMHQGEESRISDSRRVHALESMGWNVVWITNSELLSWRAMDAIAKTIFKKMGRRQRIRVEGYQSRQAQLRAELGLAIPDTAI